jgi:hypothetical protein
MRTHRDAKAMAATLRAELSERHEIGLPNSEALEIVARQFGLKDWNVLAAKIAEGGQPAVVPADGFDPTIPLLRVFSEAKARQFYLDFLGFQLDFGGPSAGPGTPFYGQISRSGTTIHLSEEVYDPAPGATVILWISDVLALHALLDRRRTEVPVWGPAVWMPPVEELPWAVRSLTIPDPFGNTLRFYEPTDRAAHPYLPTELRRWLGPLAASGS